MSSINLTILSAQDGGVVVYESLDEQVLVFAGDVKQASEYLAKRVGLLGTVAVKPIPESYYEKKIEDSFTRARTLENKFAIEA